MPTMSDALSGSPGIGSVIIQPPSPEYAAADTWSWYLPAGTAVSVQESDVLVIEVRQLPPVPGSTSVHASYDCPLKERVCIR